MFSDDFNPSPFKRSPFRRLMAKWFSWQDRALRGLTGLGSRITRPFFRLQHKLISEPLQKWQLSAEESRNRNAKPSLIRRVLHAFHYRMWRVSEWMNEHPTYFRWLTTPARWLARIPGRIGMVLGTGFEGLEKRLENSRWLFWLGYLLAGVRHLAASAYEFSSAWYFSRDFRLLLGAIPALLLFCPLAYCMVRVSFQSPVATASRYRKAAMEAREAKRFDEAQLCLRKVQQLGMFAESSQYDMAVTAAAQGKMADAIDTMQSLVDEYEYYPARLWLVQKLLSGDVIKDPEDAFSAAQAHLDAVLRIDSRDLGARYLQANLWARSGKAAEAVQVLTEISREYPPANVLLATIQRRQGQGRDAQERLKMALDFFEKRSQDGDMSTQEYRSWAMALAEAGSVEEAERRLDEGLERHSTEDNFPAEVAGSLAQLAARVGAFQPREYLRLLKRAIALDPKDEYLLSLTYTAEQPATQQETLAFLAERAKVAPLPVEVETALGVMAYQRQDFVEAREHFERVVDQDQTNAGAANNLAWLLSETDPVDLERALKYSSLAVQYAPERAEYRDTLGQILVKLRRWNDAAQQLELAVNGMTETAATHRSLAAVYEQLGNRELAAAHRRSAAQGR